MNIFQRLKQRRADRRHRRQLALLAQQHKTLIKLQEAGLLQWNPKTRQLFIAEPLALIFMQTAEKWQAFIQTVYNYEQYRLTSAAWDEYIRKEELAAVRRAIQQNGGKPIPREDVDRIKRARRSEIAQSDMQPPHLDGYEFVICRDTTDAEPQVIAVGHYDADTEQMEIATWQEVQRLLQEVKSEK